MFLIRSIICNRLTFRNNLCSSYKRKTLTREEFCNGQVSNGRNFSLVPNEEYNFKNIYTGPLASRIRAVKVFSLTTSIAGLAAQPILMEQGAKLGGTPMIILLCGFAGFFTFVTPLLLHFITKKYVTELYYDEHRDQYKAKTVSIFLYNIETIFKRNEVKVPDVPGMFTSFTVGKTRLFVDPHQFPNTDNYIRLMGYDKPIDFTLESEQNSKNK